MKSSDNVNELALALSKAQAEIRHAEKLSTNPHFKSTYADLASVWSACREVLSKNGLAVVQTFNNAEREVVLVTTLLHSSGQWMSSELPIEAPKGSGSQKQGSAITYARRYALAAMVGVVADEDDDGETAEGRNKYSHSGNGDSPQRQVQVNKVNQTHNQGPVGNPNQSDEKLKSQSRVDRTGQLNITPQPITRDIPNHAANIPDPNSAVRPSHLRDLSETGNKHGWTNDEISELSHKMTKKDSVRMLNYGELQLVKKTISSMTVEQMKKTTF